MTDPILLSSSRNKTVVRCRHKEIVICRGGLYIIIGVLTRTYGMSISRLFVASILVKFSTGFRFFGYGSDRNVITPSIGLAVNDHKNLIRNFASGLISLGLLGHISTFQFLPPAVFAAEEEAVVQVGSKIQQVPLYVQRTSDLQQYTDINRGFKLLRPFGYNEFEGAGTGYAVKFASLFDVDENVIVGSVSASADRTSITQFGTVEELGQKLAKKRGGVLLASSARETDGIVFYQFEFENPLDMSLPRTGPKNNRPTKGIELYELCVAKGRLWSVQATSNDKLFPQHENTFRHSLASFIPRL